MIDAAITKPPRNIKQRVITFGLAFFIFLVTLVVLDSQLTRWYLMHWFSNHDVELEIEQLTLNLWDGKLDINQLVATNATGRRLSVGDLSVDWDWLPLFDSEVKLNQISVQALSLDIAGTNFKPTHIGPLDLSKLSSVSPEAEPTTEEAAIWQVNVGPIELQNIDICYRDSLLQYADLAIPLKNPQKTIDNCVQWQSLRFDSQLVASTDDAMAVNGHVSMAGLNIKEWLGVESFSVKVFDFSKQQLSWDSIKLQNMQVFGGQVIADSDLSLSALSIDKSAVDLKTPSAQIGPVTLSTLAVAHQLPDNNKAKLTVGQFSVDALTSQDGEAFSVNGVEIQQLGGSYNELIATIGHLKTASIIGGLDLRLAVNETFIENVTVKQGQQALAEVKTLNSVHFDVDIAQSQADVQALGLGGLSVWQQAHDQQFHQAVTLEQLAITKASLNQSRQHVEGIEIKALGLLQNLAKTDASSDMLISIADIEVDKITGSEGIEVGQVNIDGLDSLLVLSPDSGLNVNNWFYAPDDEKLKSKVETDPSPSKPFTINKLTLGYDAKVTLVESTLGKPQTHQFSKIRMMMAPLSFGPQATPANIALVAKIEQSGLFNTKGVVTLNPQALNVDLKGKIEHLAMTAYSNYSARHIGYRIEQGQLDIDFDVKVINNQIDSNLALLLKKFELGDLQKHEQSPANKALGLPLPTALNLLRDSDSNIALSFPIKGDLQQPDFSLSSVVTTVTFKALKAAVLYTYSPLGMLSVAGSLVDLATALRFKPVIFAAQDITLDDIAKAQLDKVGQVLSKKQKVELVMCANGTLQDLPPVTATDANGQTVVVAHQGGLDALTDEQRQSMLDMASQRQSAAQAYLVDNHGIAAHRLLLCNVKFDEKADAAPVVAISI